MGRGSSAGDGRSIRNCSASLSTNAIANSATCIQRMTTMQIVQVKLMFRLTAGCSDRDM